MYVIWGFVRKYRCVDGFVFSWICIPSVAPHSPSHRSTQAIIELRQNNFQPTPKLLEYLGNLFGMIGQSKIVEDGFHFERRGEQAQDSGRMAPERKWLLLLEKKVISTVHKYQDLDWHGMPLPRGMKDLPMQDLFAERLGRTSMPFDELVSFSPRTPWWSPGPDSECLQHADLAVMMRCNAVGGWDMASVSWLALLGRVRNLCVHHPDYGERFYFIVGDVHAEALWGWPADSKTGAGETVYTLKRINTWDEVRLLVVLSAVEWQAFEYEWVAPAALSKLGFADTSIAAKPKHAPVSLLEACALCAFGTLSLTPLTQLARHLEVRIQRGSSLFDVVWALLRHAHPSMSEADMWRVMERRWHSQDILTHLLPENLLDQVDEKDAEEVRFVKKKSRTSARRRRSSRRGTGPSGRSI